MTDKFRALEKMIKGGANHWRLKILFLLKQEPGLSLSAISDGLEAHFKTIAQHASTLHRSGLIEKNYRSRSVIHILSPLGAKFLNLISKL
ncbi:MAG: hypothetical protein AAB885_03145 [Patescibacteria group bacterium]